MNRNEVAEMMQFASLGVQTLLRESFDQAVLAGTVYFHNGVQRFPLAPHPEMDGIPGWVGSEGIRDSEGGFHLPAKTMAALLGMPIAHFEHHLEQDFGIQITPPEVG